MAAGLAAVVVLAAGPWLAGGVAPRPLKVDADDNSYQFAKYFPLAPPIDDVMVRLCFNNLKSKIV